MPANGPLTVRLLRAYCAAPCRGVDTSTQVLQFGRGRLLRTRDRVGYW